MDHIGCKLQCRAVRIKRCLLFMCVKGQVPERTCIEDGRDGHFGRPLCRGAQSSAGRAPARPDATSRRCWAHPCACVPTPPCSVRCDLPNAARSGNNAAAGGMQEGSAGCTCTVMSVSRQMHSMLCMLETRKLHIIHRTHSCCASYRAHFVGHPARLLRNSSFE